MAPTGMIQKLNAQMNREFYSSSLCLRLSTWCSGQKLYATAILLRNQAQNNVTQMMRVFNFVKQTGSTPVVDEVEALDCECKNLEDLFQKTLDDYQLRRETLAHLIAIAHANNNIKVLYFLKSLDLDIQKRKDGQLLNTILNKVRCAKKAGLGMSQTDQQLLLLISGHKISANAEIEYVH